MYKYLCGHVFSILLGRHLGEELLLGHRVTLYLPFEELSNCFHYIHFEGVHDSFMRDRQRDREEKRRGKEKQEERTRGMLDIHGGGASGT